MTVTGTSIDIVDECVVIENGSNRVLLDHRERRVDLGGVSR